MGDRFSDLLSRVTQIGLEHHAETIIENSKANVPHITNTIRAIQPIPSRVLVISAGPSLHRESTIHRLKNLDFKGVVVCADGAYIKCLKAGIRVDYVVTLDPHPTRMVRWFGDPDLRANSANDNYFERQDLDIAFRRNAETTNALNIELVNRFAGNTKFIISSTSPANVVRRLQNTEGQLYWFTPLVDDPDGPESLTRRMVEITKLPAMNTGGTVGTACWVFAHSILKAPRIGLVGMDFSYPLHTPLEQTQEWNMLKGEGVEDFYPKKKGFWGECIASPTYAFYLQNFLDLLKASGSTVTNCTEGGLLQGPGVECMSLESWAKQMPANGPELPWDG